MQTRGSLFQLCRLSLTEQGPGERKEVGGVRTRFSAHRRAGSRLVSGRGLVCAPGELTLRQGWGDPFSRPHTRAASSSCSRAGPGTAEAWGGWAGGWLDGRLPCPLQASSHQPRARPLPGLVLCAGSPVSRSERRPRGSRCWEPDVVGTVRTERGAWGSVCWEDGLSPLPGQKPSDSPGLWSSRNAVSVGFGIWRLVFPDLGPS